MAKQVFPFKSFFGPALTVLGDIFYLAWTDPKGILQIASDFNGWSPDPVRVDLNSSPETSSARPALTVFQGKLFIAWAGTDGQKTLSIAQWNADDRKAHNKHVLWGETSPFGPALTARANPTPRVVLAWTGSNAQRTLCYRTSPDGLNWADQDKLITQDASIDGPALANNGDRDHGLAGDEIFTAWTSVFPSPPFLNFAANGLSSKHVYNGDPSPGPDTSNRGPSVAYDSEVGNTYLGYSGQDQQHIYVLASGGGTEPPTYRDKLEDTSPFAPALAIKGHGGDTSNLFVAWTGTNGSPGNLCFAAYDSLPFLYKNGNG